MGKTPFVCVLHLSASDQCPSVKDAAPALWLCVCSWHWGHREVLEGCSIPGGWAVLCWSVLPWRSLRSICYSLMISMCLSGSPLLCHNPASVICESDFLLLSLFCQLILWQEWFLRTEVKECIDIPWPWDMLLCVKETSNSLSVGFHKSTARGAQGMWTPW